MASTLSSEAEIIHSKVENPVFRALVDHVKLEMEWSLSEKDLYSFCWSLASLSKRSKNDVKQVERLLEKHMENLKSVKDLRPFLTSTYVLGLCLGIKVLSDEGKRIPRSHVNMLQRILDECRKRKWFKNHEFASSILFSLANVKDFNGVTSEAAEWVENRCETFLDNNNYENMIDCLFGTLQYKQKKFQLPVAIMRRILENLNNLSDERLAKVILLSSHVKLNKSDISVLADELEKRLKKEFQNRLNLSLERGLRELINLLRSGYPPQTTKTILESLKKKDVSWAGDLKISNNSIVIEKPPKLDYFPRIDPKTHALMLTAFRATNRTIIYQLNKEEFEKAKNAVKQKAPGFQAIKRRALAIMLVFTGILWTATFLRFFIYTPTTSWNEIISIFWEIYPNPFMLFIYALRFGWSYLLLVLSWVIYLRGLNLIIKQGEIKRNQIIDLIPGLRKVVNFFLGERGEY
jgi:hypothetical protein